MRYLAAVALGALIGAGVALAQGSGRVDFARDVQPILREHCFECHGPKQQRNGFRLDRRREALRGGSSVMIGPGNSAGSRLYLRLVGDRYGTRMPPDDPLSGEQIATVKKWIDQGAEWPDELAGEEAPPPPDPGASRLMEALRQGERAQWLRLVRDRPALANRKGPGGSTPLMYAALYGDAAAVRTLLEIGADPNARNEAGATALMWAVRDREKVELLVGRGADVNARSNDGRTPLLIAASWPGGLEVVKLLLDHGAAPVVKGTESPLNPAASNEPLVKLLLERGADPASVGPFALLGAAVTRCQGCLDLLAGPAGPQVVNDAAVVLGPPFGNGLGLPALLDRGVRADATDGDGRTLLMLAASSEAAPLPTLRALLERGADVNARSPRGETALSLARRAGQTATVDLLLEAGAREVGEPGLVAPARPQPAGSIAEALRRTVPLLQRADEAFRRKSGCVSCHHDTLTPLALAGARRIGVAVDEPLAGQQIAGVAAYLDGWRERVLQGKAIPGRSDSIGQMLLALAVANRPADATTDAMALMVKAQQLPDGHWPNFAHRPPSEASPFQVTATGLRVLRTYAPAVHRRDFEAAARAAADWLLRATPRSTEDRAFLLLGLGWSGLPASHPAVQKAARELLAQQRPEGGWPQLASLDSDAYATGQALYALREAAGLGAGDAACQRAVAYLLGTQLQDGSWHVRSRAIPLQPMWDSGFPHGRDQWISAAATHWSAMALASAASPRAGR